MLLYLIQKRGNKYHVRRIRKLESVERQPRSWQSDAHGPARRRILAIIELEFHKRKPNASKKMKEKLSLVAKKAEKYFYQKAGSFEEYSDRGTLPSRIEGFATMLLERARRLQRL